MSWGNRRFFTDARWVKVEPLVAGVLGPGPQRNVIERWFGRLKVFRRIATRYEKTALSYLGAVAAAAWLVSVTGWNG